MKKQYIVRLTPQEQKQLNGIIKRGKGPAYRIRHAYILLHADMNESGKTDDEIARILQCHPQTVFSVRKKFFVEGLTRAVGRKQRESVPRPRKLDGAKEARLITLACSHPPEGFTQWTLQLLADNMVELKLVDTISAKTIGRVLKKRIKATPATMLGNSSRTKR